MENTTANSLSSFFDVILLKIKEQSFVIILMLAAVYFQNKMFTERIDACKATIEKQQDYIDKLVEEERNRLIERDAYLIQQRDKFVEELIFKKQ